MIGVGRWVTRAQRRIHERATSSPITASPEGAAAAVAAFPLRCRARTIGALIALDPAPSTEMPELPPPLLSSLRIMLEAPALALDTTLHLQRAEALSVTDDLTSLYNSRYLNQVLRRESKRASRSGRPLSLLFIDLDGFKSVNDTPRPSVRQPGARRSGRRHPQLRA